MTLSVFFRVGRIRSVDRAAYAQFGRPGSPLPPSPFIRFFYTYIKDVPYFEGKFPEKFLEKFPERFRKSFRKFLESFQKSFQTVSGKFLEKFLESFRKSFRKVSGKFPEKFPESFRKSFWNKKMRFLNFHFFQPLGWFEIVQRSPQKYRKRQGELLRWSGARDRRGVVTTFKRPKNAPC